MEIISGLIILVILLVIGVPIPFCFALVVLYLVNMLEYTTTFLTGVGYTHMDSVTLLAIPLFILAGGIMEKSRIGEVLVEVVEKFTGHINGGLGVVAAVGSGAFGAISGSAAATCTCIGTILAPLMKERKYPHGILAAVITTSGTLGLLIPPSASCIVYAWLTNQSVLACFLSTLVPGLIAISLISLVSCFLLRHYPLKSMEKTSVRVWAKELRKSTVEATPALVMPVIILGGIYSGIMTATESASVAVIYSIFVGLFIYKTMKLKELSMSLGKTATTTGVVMVMLFFVMMLSRILVLENIPNKLINILLGISDSKLVILLAINIFMIIMGMLMDDVSSMLLCAPLLLPLAMTVGVNPIHFCAIVCVNLGMGNLTPPTAPLLYLGARVCNVSVNEMLVPSIIFLIFAWVPTLLLTTYIPEIALFVPKMVLGAF